MTDLIARLSRQYDDEGNIHPLAKEAIARIEQLQRERDTYKDALKELSKRVWDTAEVREYAWRVLNPDRILTTQLRGNCAAKS